MRVALSINHQTLGNPKHEANQNEDGMFQTSFLDPMITLKWKWLIQLTLDWTTCRKRCSIGSGYNNPKVNLILKEILWAIVNHTGNDVRISMNAKLCVGTGWEISSRSSQNASIIRRKEGGLSKMDTTDGSCQDGSRINKSLQTSVPERSTPTDLNTKVKIFLCHIQEMNSKLTRRVDYVQLYTRNKVYCYRSVGPRPFLPHHKLPRTERGSLHPAAN